MFYNFISKYTDIFCSKNARSFCTAKAFHIFSTKNIGDLRAIAERGRIWLSRPCYSKRKMFLENDTLQEHTRLIYYMRVSILLYFLANDLNFYLLQVNLQRLVRVEVVVLCLI